MKEFGIFQTVVKLHWICALVIIIKFTRLTFARFQLSSSNALSLLWKPALNRKFRFRFGAAHCNFGFLNQTRICVGKLIMHFVFTLAFPSDSLRPLPFLRWSGAQLFRVSCEEYEETIYYDIATRYRIAHDSASFIVMTSWVSIYLNIKKVVEMNKGLSY